MMAYKAFLSREKAEEIFNAESLYLDSGNVIPCYRVAEMFGEWIKDFDYRLAEINFDEDTEQAVMDRIEQVMRIKGYDLNQVTNGYASCQVEDRNEYEQFVQDYKEVKKSVKLWIRFGI